MSIKPIAPMSAADRTQAMADIAEMKAALQAALAPPPSSGEARKEIGNTPTRGDASKALDSKPASAGEVKPGSGVTDVDAVKVPPGYDEKPATPARKDASQSRGAQAALKGTVKVAGRKNTLGEGSLDVKEPYPRPTSAPRPAPKERMPGSGL